MRGLLVLCFAFAAAASGCVELAGSTDDPDVEAIAGEAAAFAANYTARTGHLAGIVYDADGEPLDGAIVSIGDALPVRTDLGGQFAAVDLEPGRYLISVVADGHQDWASTYSVQAGKYTRPEIHLESALPGPYVVQHMMDGYSQFTTLFGGPCACRWSGELLPEDSEGLQSVVLEARRIHSTDYLGSGAFDYSVSSWAGDDEVAYEAGYVSDPLYVTLDPALFAGADHFELDVHPYNMLAELQTSFEVALTFFYHDAAPEGYTAF